MTGQANAQAPAAQLLAAAQAVSTTTDARGRALTLRRLGALDKLRLFKAAGPALAQNPAWLGMAALACSVIEIEGVPVPSPVNDGQIEALVARLGDDGLAAVASALDAKADCLPRQLVGN
jgi:hypothetical protein